MINILQVNAASIHILCWVELLRNQVFHINSFDTFDTYHISDKNK